MLNLSGFAQVQAPEEKDQEIARISTGLIANGPASSARSGPFHTRVPDKPELVGKMIKSAVTLVVWILLSLSVHAEHVGRLPATPGGTDFQAVYDTDREITWVADANLSRTLPLPGHAGRRMNWAPTPFHFVPLARIYAGYTSEPRATKRDCCGFSPGWEHLTKRSHATSPTRFNAAKRQGWSS